MLWIIIGAKVIIACRDVAKANEAATEIQSETGFIGKVKVMKLDLTSLKSIRQFVEDFKKGMQCIAYVKPVQL